MTGEPAPDRSGTGESRLPAKALLLDLDGTILDTAGDLMTGLNRTLVELGRSEVDEDQVRAWIGDGVRALVRRGLEASGGYDDALLDQAHERFMVHYGDCFTDATSPYPGVIETLDRFRQAGLPMAVITNKAAAFTEPLLEATGILAYLGTVISGDQVTRKKPDPEGIRRALEELGVAADDAAFVGDSANDVTAGLEAGCYVVCVTYGYNRGEDVNSLGAHRVTETFTGLLDFLRLPEVPDS